MKRLNNIIKIALVVISAALLGACNDATGTYLKVSDSSFSLDGAGVNEHLIEVSASSSWKHTINDGWIKEVSKSGKGLTVKATPYYGTDSRVGSITFETDEMIVKVTVFQLNCLVTSVVNDLFTYGEPSPLGFYIAGMQYPDDTSAIPTSIDIRTGEVVEYDAVDHDLEVSCVDDKGNIFIIDPWFAKGGWRVDAATREIAAMEVSDDMNCGGVSGVSSDGSVWVGFGCPKAGNYVAMKWVNGVPERLPITETNATGIEKVWYGSVARGCSDDGSVIYGSFMDYSESIYWNKDGEFNVVAPELVEFTDNPDLNDSYRYNLTAAARCYADKQRISPNGKWLSFRYENDVTNESYPGYIDTETGVVTLCKEHSSYDIMPISNNLDLVLYPAAAHLENTMHVTPDGKKMTSMEWIEQEYGLIIEDNRAVTQIAANGNIAGWKYIGNTYVSWWLERE